MPVSETLSQEAMLYTRWKRNGSFSTNNHQRCSIEKGVLKNFKNSPVKKSARVSFLIKLQASACSFIKKDTLAQVYSCEFC